MNTHILLPEFLARFVGGTLDFTFLGREAAGGVEKVELFPGSDGQIRFSFDWTAVIEEGCWHPLSPHIDYLATSSHFVTKIEGLGQNRLNISFLLGQHTSWSWILKPPYRGRRITYDMHAGLVSTTD